MPPSRSRIDDDEQPTTLQPRHEPPEVSEVTVTNGPETATVTSMPVQQIPDPVPSVPSVVTTPQTVVDMPMPLHTGEVPMPVNTLEDMPAARPPLDEDDDPTTRAGIPKKIQQQHEKPKPKAKPAPAPLLTPDPMSAVSRYSAPTGRRHPLVAISIVFVGVALALLVLNWLMASPEPTNGSNEPQPSRLHRMFDW